MKKDELASIRRFFGSRDYVYICGDATRAYWKELGLKKFWRHVLFVDRRLLVICDEVETDRPRRYDWLLHAPTPFKSRDMTTFTTESDGAWLFVKMLQPTAVSHVAEEFTVRSGVKWDIDGSVKIPEKGFPVGHWLDVWPSSKRHRQRFVAVLFPGGKGEPQPAVSLTQGGTGVHVAAGEMQYAVAHVSDDGALRAGRMTGRGVRGWICAEQGKPAAFAIEGGTSLAWDGKPLVEASAPVTFVWRGGRATAHAESAAEVTLRLPRAARVVAAGKRDVPVERTGDAIRIRLSSGRTELTLR